MSERDIIDQAAERVEAFVEAFGRGGQYDTDVVAFTPEGNWHELTTHDLRTLIAAARGPEIPTADNSTITEPPMSWEQAKAEVIDAARKAWQEQHPGIINRAEARNERDRYHYRREVLGEWVEDAAEDRVNRDHYPEAARAADTGNDRAQPSNNSDEQPDRCATCHGGITHLGGDRYTHTVGSDRIMHKPIPLRWPDTTAHASWADIRKLAETPATPATRSTEALCLHCGEAITWSDGAARGSAHPWQHDRTMSAMCRPINRGPSITRATPQ